MLALTRLLLTAMVAFGFVVPHAAVGQSRGSTVRTQWPAPREVDERRAALAGIRKVEGRHLRLYTDLPASDAVDELPEVFDAAVSQWAAYFKLTPRQVAGWRVQGFLIEDRARFAAQGLLPEKNRDYINGYAYGYELWLDEQPSDYYRRHLMLHEGVHSFMLTQFGSAGPGWYMEGVAELLATHRWNAGQLEVNVLPADSDEVPMWGRIRLIRDAHHNGRILSLDGVLAIDNRQALATDAYAWCWSLSKFLDSHPRHASKFRELKKLVARDDFTQRFRRMFQSEWSDLNVEWEAFVAALDYGYDLERMAIVHSATSPVNGPRETTIAADRGWQSTGWLLESGKEYMIAAEGRYQIAADPDPWPCEPGGVTLRYHEGQPLGMLIGALRPVGSNAERDETDEIGFAHPIAIGLGTTIAPVQDVVLYLRVNDSPAELTDNQGQLQVRVTPTSDGDGD